MSSENSESLIKCSKYGLLKNYMKQSKIKATALCYVESYYRNLYKYLTYPLVVLSAVSGTLSALDVNNYIVMSLSLSSLILVGFNSVINPKDKENNAHNVSVEFNEISRSIKQFIYANNRTKEEIKNFSEIVISQINIWESLTPPIKIKFIKKAKLDCADKNRSHNNFDIKKKEEV